MLRGPSASTEYTFVYPLEPSVTVGNMITNIQICTITVSLRWIDRCIKAHSRPHEQNLFGIVQGGLDRDLRTISLEQLTTRELPGFAIGGLAGGEEKDQFWRVVEQCTAVLPAGKPRYVMGIGKGGSPVSTDLYSLFM